MRRLLLRRVPAARPDAPSPPPSPPDVAGPCVLGIDPGTLRVGFAIVASGPAGPRALEFGVIRLPASTPLSGRLGSIHAGIVSLCRRWSPASAAVEAAFHGKSALAALRIGEGRGAAIAAAASSGIPVASYSPAEVKKAVVGSGAAHKTQVQAMLKAQLGLAAPPEPLDASDALAVALCHLHRISGIRGP